MECVVNDLINAINLAMTTKTKKKLQKNCQDSQYPGQDLKPASPKYEVPLHRPLHCLDFDIV
jgi:hypothetical protein